MKTLLIGEISRIENLIDTLQDTFAYINLEALWKTIERYAKLVESL